MHGQPAVLCTFHDITAREESERQVAESAAMSEGEEQGAQEHGVG